MSCSSVGQKNSVELLVSTFLLQTSRVGQYGLLVVLLLEELIALILQTLCLLCRSEISFLQFLMLRKMIQDFNRDSGLHLPSGGLSSSWMMAWRQASSGCVLGSISSGAVFMNIGILLNSWRRQEGRGCHRE